MSADAFDAVQTVCAAYLGELPVWEEVHADPSRLHLATEADGHQRQRHTLR